MGYGEIAWVRTQSLQSLNILRSKHGLYSVAKFSPGCQAGRQAALPTAVRRPGYKELVTLDLSVCASDRSCLSASLLMSIIADNSSARDCEG
jgi:hypothetical protein